MRLYVIYSSAVMVILLALHTQSRRDLAKCNAEKHALIASYNEARSVIDRFNAMLKSGKLGWPTNEYHIWFCDEHNRWNCTNWHNFTPK
jgi:hypothetical protein